MTLLVKDANTTVQSLSTVVDGNGNLVPAHAPATTSAQGVATPVGPQNPLPVVNTAGSAAGDGSGTVAAGGTAQTLFGGAVPANGFLVQNNSSAALWICVLNPLVIIHLMGGVHNEMLMVGLMMAGIALTFSGRRRLHPARRQWRDLRNALGLQAGRPGQSLRRHDRPTLRRPPLVNTKTRGRRNQRPSRRAPAFAEALLRMRRDCRWHQHHSSS